MGHGTGFSKAYSGFQNGNRPDVLRGTPDDRYLFVGDAKDSEHETVDNGETVARIASYIRDFAEHLGNPGYRGGYIAIVTDSLAAAHAWVPALNLLARAACITAGSDHRAPNFQVHELRAGQSWIVYW